MKQEFTRELNQAKAMLEKRTRQAKIALEANEQELHEQAMEEVKHYETRVDQLTGLNDNTVKELETLETTYVET